MSRNLDLLTALTREGLDNVLAYCTARNIDLLVTCTYRSPEEQAELYASGRVDLRTKIEVMRCAGLAPMAELLEKVTPKPNLKKLTNAGPGESFHQLGEAFDVCPLVNGKPMWDSSHPAWQVYGTAVRRSGLFWAGDWPRFREYPHAQLGRHGNPLVQYSAEEILRRITLLEDSANGK